MIDWLMMLKMKTFIFEIVEDKEITEAPQIQHKN